MSQVAIRQAVGRFAAPARDDDSSWLRPLLFLAFAAASFAYQETSVLPALQTIQRSLPGATSSLTAFLESGYLVIAAVAAPTIGKFGDRRGKKGLLLVTMVTYFVGALGAALAPTFAVLVLFRAVQGAGGAIFALSFAIMRDIAPKRVPVAVGVLVGAFGTGTTVGFASAGAVTSDLSWRWVFLIEAALIVVATLLVARYVPAAGKHSDVPADLPGAGLLGLGVGALIVGLTIGSVTGWAAAPPIGLLAGSALLLAAWIGHERRKEQPLLDVTVLTQRNVLLPNIGSALAGYAAFSVYLAVPRIATTQRGLPPALAGRIHYGFALDVVALGLLMMPIGLGVLTGGPLGGFLGRRYGGKWPFVGGLGLLAVFCAALAGVHNDLYAVGAWLYMVGAGFGLSVGAAGTFITEAAPEGSTGVATAFNSLVRLIGGGIGAQIATIIVLAGQYSGAPAAHEWAFVVVFAIAAGLAGIGTLAATLVPSGNQ